MFAPVHPMVFESLLGSSSLIVSELIGRDAIASILATPELCLDVLMHAADADAGILIGSDGTVMGAVGLSDAEAVELTIATRCGVTGFGRDAELALSSRTIAYTSMELPVGPGSRSTLVLASTRRPLRIDIEAIVPLLAGVTFALAIPPRGTENAA